MCAVAEPVLVEVAGAVALILHVAAPAGAVNSPVLLIEPHDVDHVTDWLAVNCTWPIACKDAVVGVTVTWPVPAVTVTVVEAVVPPVVAVAFTVQDCAVS